MSCCLRLATMLLVVAAVLAAPSDACAWNRRAVHFTPVGTGAVRLQVTVSGTNGAEARPPAFDGWVTPAQTVVVVDEGYCFWYRHTYGALRKVNWSDWTAVCRPRKWPVVSSDLWIRVPTDRPSNVR